LAVSDEIPDLKRSPNGACKIAIIKGKELRSPGKRNLEGFNIAKFHA